MISMKPTTFGLVHMHEMRVFVEALPFKGMCRRVAGGHACGHVHVPLSGTDAFGNFVTAPYKQYTTELNQAIAVSAIVAWQRLGFTSKVSEDAYEHDAAGFYTPLDPYADNQGWGAFGADLACHHMPFLPVDAESNA